MVSRQFYSLSEIETILGIGKTTVFKYVREGKIPSVLVVGKRLVPKSFVDETIAQAMEQAEDSAGVAV